MNEEKTHWKKEFNYDYLGAYSLLPGQELVLTIKETKKEMVVGGDGKKQECFVAYFVEPQKPMILNRTNCKAITKMYGTPYIEEWNGKKVQIFATMVKAFGEETDALRIRPTVPKDYTELLKAVKACKTVEDLELTYNLNKADWSSEVKAAAQARRKEIETQNPKPNENTLV